MYEITYTCRYGERVDLFESTKFDTYERALKKFKDETSFVTDDSFASIYASISCVIEEDSRVVTVEEKGGSVKEFVLRKCAEEPEDNAAYFFNELLPEERSATASLNKDYILAKAKEYLLCEWLCDVALFMRALGLAESMYDMKINGTYCSFVLHAHKLNDKPFSFIKDAIYNIPSNIPNDLASLAKECVNKEYQNFYPTYTAVLSSIFSRLSLNATQWLSRLETYESYIVYYLTLDKKQQEFAPTEYFGKFHRDGTLAPAKKI